MTSVAVAPSAVVAEAVFVPDAAAQPSAANGVDRRPPDDRRAGRLAAVAGRAVVARQPHPERSAPDVQLDHRQPAGSLAVHQALQPDRRRHRRVRAVRALDPARPALDRRVVLTAAIGLSTGGYRAAFWGTLAMFGVGVVGYWDLTMITLALMIVSIVLALVIGIPIGIWTGPLRSRRAPAAADPRHRAGDAGVRLPRRARAGVRHPVPAGGVRDHRLRHSARGAPHQPRPARRAGRDERGRRVVRLHGAQQLIKVQLPLARRTILLGLNQVIMMAFGIVVIGSLLGTGDVGNRCSTGCRRSMSARRSPRRAWHRVRRRSPSTASPPASATRRRVVRAGVRPARPAAVRGARRRRARRRCVDHGSPALTVSRRARRRHHRGRSTASSTGSATTSATACRSSAARRSISDFLVTDMLEPLRELLEWPPWWSSSPRRRIGWLSGGWRLA